MTPHLLLPANTQHIHACGPAFLNGSSGGADPECPSPSDGHCLKPGQPGASGLTGAEATQKLAIPPESGYYKNDLRKKSPRWLCRKVLNSPSAKVTQHQQLHMDHFPLEKI